MRRLLRFFSQNLWAEGKPMPETEPMWNYRMARSYWMSLTFSLSRTF